MALYRYIRVSHPLRGSRAPVLAVVDPQIVPISSESVLVIDFRRHFWPTCRWCNRFWVRFGLHPILGAEGSSAGAVLAQCATKKENRQKLYHRYILRKGSLPSHDLRRPRNGALPLPRDVGHGCSFAFRKVWFNLVASE